MLSLIPFYALGNTPALSQNQLTSHPDIKGGAPTNGELETSIINCGLIGIYLQRSLGIFG